MRRAASIAALALAACSGKTTLDVGSNRAATTAPDAAPPVTIPVSHAPPYDAATVAAAKAACDGAHGPLDPFTTVGDVEARLTGAWFGCSSDQAQYYPATSVEYAADGHWYLLEPTDDGGLARSQGIDHEGTWHVNDPPTSGAEPPAGSPSDGLVMGQVEGFAQFEKGPRRMKLEVVTAGAQLWFVYLGPSDPT